MTELSAALGALTGILLTIVFAWLVPRLTGSRGTIVVLLGFALFIVEYAVNMVEGYFFSTVFPSLGHFLIALPAVAAVTFVQAGLAAFLLSAEPGGVRFQEALGTFTSGRGLGNWVVRSIVAAAAYLPVYLSFGAVVGPIVLPYYSNPQFGLVMPAIPTILLVELFRGALYVLALFPVLAVLRWSRWTAFLAVASLIYIPGSFLPLVTRTWLPTQVIVLQSLELLGDALVYAFLLSKLLAPKK